jgi:hypothetical protein
LRAAQDSITSKVYKLEEEKKLCPCSFGMLVADEILLVYQIRNF